MSHRDGQRQLTPRESGEVYGTVITKARGIGKNERRRQERLAVRQQRKERIESLREVRKLWNLRELTH